MKVQIAKTEDFNNWLKLAQEVESLFGPMTKEESFKAALKELIIHKQAFCIKNKSDILGAIAISKDENEILWFAVANKHKGNGYGRLLLEYAINKLDKSKSITVQTFSEEIIIGKPARELYQSFGFVDLKKSENNPAGYPTVIMIKS